MNKHGETTNLPDDDDQLAPGGDAATGPGWMELWSSVSYAPPPPSMSGCVTDRGLLIGLQACKDAATAMKACGRDKPSLLPHTDEFNVEFMARSAQAYDTAAGLTKASAAKL